MDTHLEQRKTVLITGATSGFGRAMAQRFAREGWNVVITGRREERLQEVIAQLQALGTGASFHTLAFDIQNEDAATTALQAWADAYGQLHLLINNAGLAAGLDPVDEADPRDWMQMIDTNLKGLLYATHTLLPALKAGAESGGAHIINIGSTAAKTAYRAGAVYSATKAAVDALTRGMRIDLLPHRIKVTAVHPGAAETEFSAVRFKGDWERARKVYEGFVPLSAEDVADVVYYCASLPPHVCINDVVLTALAQADSTHIHRG